MTLQCSTHGERMEYEPDCAGCQEAVDEMLRLADVLRAGFAAIRACTPPTGVPPIGVGLNDPA